MYINVIYILIVNTNAKYYKLIETDRAIIHYISKYQHYVH